MTNHLLKISTCGQSIGLDHLSHAFIASGALKQMPQHQDLRGIISKPALFKAIAGSATDIKVGQEYVQPFSSLLKSLEDKVKQLAAIETI